MARSSEIEVTDLLEDIQRHINEYSGGLSEDHSFQLSMLAAPQLSHKALPSLHQCEAEVQALGLEIAELEATSSKNKMGKDAIIKALNDVTNRLPFSEQHENTEADITRIEKELELLASLTGVTISKTKYTVVDVGDDFLRKHHLLKGSCRSTAFAIHFDVDETWVNGEESTTKMKNIKVVVPAPDRAALMPMLESIDKLASLPLIFRVLTSYAQWKADKDNLVATLIDQHPGAVGESESGTLIIKPPQAMGCEWHFEFGMTLSSNLVTSSNINLQVKVPEHCADLAEKSVLRLAPTEFKSMEKTLGGFTAIQVLAKTLLQ